MGTTASYMPRLHVLSSIRAAMADSNGFPQEAEKLRAQSTLRLITMNGPELEELARLCSYSPTRPPETVLVDLKEEIREAVENPQKWVPLIGETP